MFVNLLMFPSKTAVFSLKTAGLKEGFYINRDIFGDPFQMERNCSKSIMNHLNFKRYFQSFNAG